MATHTPPFRAQGTPSEDAGLGFTNPYPTPGTPLERAQRKFLKEHVAPQLAHGEIDEEDLKALPVAVRRLASQLAKDAAELRSRGTQATAAMIVEEQLATLHNALPEDWEPPATDRPDPDVIDAIRSRGRAL